MKKLIMSLAVAVMLCVVGAECGSSVPKATDEGVQSLVFQIAKDAMLDSLAPHLFTQITGFRLGAKKTYAKVKTLILSNKNINATDQKTRDMVKRARVTFAKILKIVFPKDINKPRCKISILIMTSSKIWMSHCHKRFGTKIS